ncbi:MAG: pyruvate dehydrogenase complex dihydrolipoamide acetyltransferase [Pseudomonadota bacterium]
MPIPILMPALSPTMEEGTLAKWHVKEGDTVASGDVIAEIETDKATMEVEAVDEGTVGRILISEGTENVKVNETIAMILEEGEDAGALDAAPAPPLAPVPSSPPAPAEPDAPPAPSARPVTNGAALGSAPVSAAVAPTAGAASEASRIFASPLAKRIAGQEGLDLAALTGSGPHGRIIKRDVLSALANPAPARGLQAAATGEPKAQAPTSEGGLSVPGTAPASELGYAEGSYTLVKADGMRKTIARRLTEAKIAIPHYYLTIECELDALLAVRKDLNARSPEGEGAFKISVNDFLIRASALALKRVPAANASWSADGILEHHSADIAVAVAIDGGLITPVIRQAETKGLATLANEAKSLAKRARERKLAPEEYQGGTFSISNLGMFGIKTFTAVINPPHSMIMAVGAGEQRPVIRNGAVAAATVMSVTLSCDHRVVDGALGAEFLGHFKGFIEDPMTLML